VIQWQVDVVNGRVTTNPQNRDMSRCCGFVVQHSICCRFVVQLVVQQVHNKSH